MEKGSRALLKQFTQTLNCVLTVCKTHFLQWSLIEKSSHNKLELVTKPGGTLAVGTRAKTPTEVTVRLKAQTDYACKKM